MNKPTLFYRFIQICIVIAAIAFVGWYGYCAWDETIPASSDILANSQSDIQSNFNAINATFGDLLDTGTAISANAVELNYVDGVTSAIQTQLDAKSNTASPTFTGTVTIPTADIATLNATAAETNTTVTDFNADFLDGYSTATTNTANLVPVLDANGSVVPFLRKYDSGWFACAVNTTYNKTHDLGTADILTNLYFSPDNTAGNIIQSIVTYDETSSLARGGIIYNVNSTALQVISGGSKVQIIINSVGAPATYTSGYYRVVAIGLE